MSVPDDASSGLQLYHEGAPKAITQVIAIHEQDGDDLRAELLRAIREARRELNQLRQQIRYDTEQQVAAG